MIINLQYVVTTTSNMRISSVMQRRRGLDWSWQCRVTDGQMMIPPIKCKRMSHTPIYSKSHKGNFIILWCIIHGKYMREDNILIGYIPTYIIHPSEIYRKWALKTSFHITVLWIRGALVRTKVCETYRLIITGLCTLACNTTSTTFITSSRTAGYQTLVSSTITHPYCTSSLWMFSLIMTCTSSTRVNYGRPSVTDYRQAECLDDRQTNWLACEHLGPLDSAAMRWSKGVESRRKGFASTLPQLDIYSNKDLLLHYITPND